MRIEVTAIFCIAAIVVIFLLSRSRGALTGKHFLICAGVGLVLTLASLLYSETRYSGTILQEFRGFPRSFYLIKKSSPGEPFSPGSHFHWRFFVENLLIYTSALVILVGLGRRLLMK